MRASFWRSCFGKTSTLPICQRENICGFQRKLIYIAVQLGKPVSAQLWRGTGLASGFSAATGGQTPDYGGRRLMGGGGAKAGPSHWTGTPALVRGIVLWERPGKQEVVVDYSRNLVGLTFFQDDPQESASWRSKPTMPNNIEWAFP